MSFSQPFIKTKTWLLTVGRLGIQRLRHLISRRFLVEMDDHHTTMLGNEEKSVTLHSSTAPVRGSGLLFSLPALLLSAVCLLPFLNKAFTIDDPVYVLQAQQILKKPFRPMALDICWTVDAECGPVGNQMVGNV